LDNSSSLVTSSTFCSSRLLSQRKWFTKDLRHNTRGLVWDTKPVVWRPSSTHTDTYW